jgi:hypothetical protein
VGGSRVEPVPSCVASRLSCQVRLGFRTVSLRTLMRSACFFCLANSYVLCLVRSICAHLSMYELGTASKTSDERLVLNTLLRPPYVSKSSRPLITLSFLECDAMRMISVSYLTCFQGVSPAVYVNSPQPLYSLHGIAISGASCHTPSTSGTCNHQGDN